MTATLIDGKAVAAAQRQRIAGEVEELQAAGVTPGLAAVLVGDDPASHVYVGMKEKDCAAVGMTSSGVRLPADVDTATLHAEIDRLNADPAVSGIIVQMPLPAHLDEIAAQDRIDPLKDVDGLGPASQGQIMRGIPTYVPATPLGVVVLLQHHDVPLSGAEVVVVGRSTLVGRPLSMLLSLKGTDATVTMCHSRTRDLAGHTRRADVVVMAVGVRRMLTADMVMPGACVIDVGITRDHDGTLVGDVDFEAVAQVAGLITPVPGGVGPMTRAMLLENTLRAARTIAGIPLP
ncbi:MAG TPA: bifunctional 5,10-methylenetetrahydrofolate dehydrogenase/5,10-methenyltetrahydrofolate cyclohydrolase [Euzebya sp.]|nr:bifunctional 5,10-methylenetetrahydrofolate dehydrogenase/5,10-methenyltetrahydrofolate cyclohydrolase [Euzebya sp.]